MNERFDHVMNRMLTHHAVVVRHYNAIRNALPAFRRAAYRMAADLIVIQDHHFNEFVEYVQTHKMDVDAWLDEHFGPIEQLGDDRRRLLQNIKEGMTEEEYVRDFRLWGPKRRLSAPTAPAPADLSAAAPQRDEMDIDELVGYQRKTIEALKSEVRQLRRDLAVALDEAAYYKKQLAKVERVLNRSTVPAGGDR